MLWITGVKISSVFQQQIRIMENYAVEIDVSHVSSSKIITGIEKAVFIERLVTSLFDHND